MESCNCNQACGCQFGEGPTKGHCQFLIGFEVIDGRFGDVPLDGVRFAIACTFPGAIHEGNGSVALFVDQEARLAQVQAIANILSGQHGGMPWEALAGAVTSFTGPVIRPLEMTVDGIRSHFRIPGVLEVQHTPIKDVVSGAEKEIKLIYPKGGFFWNEGNICTTTAMWIDFDQFKYRHGNGYACYAEARWTNQ
jgi:hypothetical protein